MAFIINTKQVSTVKNFISHYTGSITGRKNDSSSTSDQDTRKSKIQTDDGFEFDVDPDTLISQSKYFKSLFQYDKQPCILIHEISGFTMNQILNYVQTGDLALDGQNILPLMKAADYLMLDDILAKIRIALPKTIATSNCVDFFNATLYLDHLKMSDICYCYIQTHFESVVEQADIGDMSYVQIKTFLEDKDLNVDDEEIVWKAATRWIEEDPNQRMDRVPSLLSCVRLETCSERSIKGIMSHPFVLENEFFNSFIARNRQTDYNDVKELAVEAVRCLSDEPISLGPRRPHVVCNISFDDPLARDIRGCIGGLKMSITSQDGRLISHVPVRTHLEPRYMYISDQRIYTFNFEEPRYAYFDLLERYWVTLPSPEMSEVAQGTHSYICFVAVNDRIYAFWIKPHSASQRVTFYVPELNRWDVGRSSVFSPFRQIVQTYSAVDHHGLVYTAGTSYLPYEFRMVFGGIYNPATDRWSDYKQLPDIHNARIGVALVSWNDLLLIVQDEETSVQRFDTAEGVWSSFQSLPVRLFKPVAGVQNGQLLLFDAGDDDDDESASTALYWDQENDEWKDGSSHLSSPARIVLDDKEVVRKYHRMMMKDEWEAMGGEERDTSLSDVLLRCIEWIWSLLAGGLGDLWSLLDKLVDYYEIL